VKRDVKRMLRSGGTIYVSDVQDGNELREVKESGKDDDPIEAIRVFCKSVKLESRVADDLLRLLTVSVGFKISMQIMGVPIFLQPRFLVLLDKTSIRVATYGFVASELGDITGNGDPNTKHTKYTCRAMSPNILEKKDQLNFRVEISKTSSFSSTQQILKHDHNNRKLTRSTKNSKKSPFTWDILI
jgi:hypothetical protein